MRVRQAAARHARVEPDYLRLAEIDRYLDARPDHYRPLAELLIGTGTRISEAPAVKWPDLDLDHAVVRIYRQSDGDGGTAQTKGKKFRVVTIGPGLVETLRDLRGRRRQHGVDDDGWVFLCPRSRGGGTPAAKSRHRHTAGRCTAARAGAPGRGVARHAAALHAARPPTEEHYADLEVHFMHNAVAQTEAKIRDSAFAHGLAANSGSCM